MTLAQFLPSEGGSIFGSSVAAAFDPISIVVALAAGAAAAAVFQMLRAGKAARKDAEAGRQATEQLTQEVRALRDEVERVARRQDAAVVSAREEHNVAAHADRGRDAEADLPRANMDAGGGRDRDDDRRHTTTRAGRDPDDRRRKHFEDRGPDNYDSRHRGKENAVGRFLRRLGGFPGPDA
jgi:hypothetical protein